MRQRLRFMHDDFDMLFLLGCLEDLEVNNLVVYPLATPLALACLEQGSSLDRRPRDRPILVS